jgi:predicted DsbA family dithiol-disulfide isomerase
MADAPVLPRIPAEYWSDPLCIWAYVAQGRLEGLMAAHGDQIDLRYHIVPVFGSVIARFAAGGAWAAQGPRGRQEATARIAAAQGHPEVSGAVWVDDCPASSWAPSAAIQGVFLLQARGEVAAGAAEAYQLDLRRTFFVENRNIARRAVWLERAEALGVPRGPLEALVDDGTALARVAQDDQRRQEDRIQGSPTWIFDGGRARLYGNFAPGVLTATVDTLLAGLSPGGSRC